MAEEIKITEETKIKLFEKVLEKEHLAEVTTYNSRAYKAESDGAYEMLEVLGLHTEYIRWAIGK